jgi:hypothetical protein
LVLKTNHPATFKDVEAFFADPPPDVLATFGSTDSDHGRIESRRHAICHDVAWLFSDRRHPSEMAFPAWRRSRARRNGTEGEPQSTAVIYP